MTRKISQSNKQEVHVKVHVGDTHKKRKRRRRRGAGSGGGGASSNMPAGSASGYSFTPVLLQSGDAPHLQQPNPLLSAVKELTDNIKATHTEPVREHPLYRSFGAGAGAGLRTSFDAASDSASESTRNNHLYSDGERQRSYSRPAAAESLSERAVRAGSASETHQGLMIDSLFPSAERQFSSPRVVEPMPPNISVTGVAGIRTLQATSPRRSAAIAPQAPLTPRPLVIVGGASASDDNDTRITDSDKKEIFRQMRLAQERERYGGRRIAQGLSYNPRK